MYTFGIIGGDRRQAELARLLERDGHRVNTFGLDLWRRGVPLREAAQAEYILLPMPLSKTKGLLNTTGETVSTTEVFDLLRPEQLVLAGQVKPEQHREAMERGLTLVDYLEREELAQANAIPTAEGAVQIALEQLPVTLCGSRALVLGFGRIGRQLARLLLGFGAQVTVAERKEKNRIQAERMGCRTVGTDGLDGRLAGIQVLFNTVPALLLNGELLEQLDRNCLCVDLASVDGLEFSAADALGLHALRARGLPGKTAPVTAAEALRDTIYLILEGTA